MNSKELAQFLYTYEVYDSYQFIINTRKTIKTALFCKESILSLISKMTEEQQRWQSDFYSIYSVAPGLTSCNVPEFAHTGGNE